jgi:hypothetical protein
MIRTLIATSIAAGLMVSAAAATTVINDGSKSATVVFTPKHGASEHVTLRSHHYRTFDCKSGGTVSLGDDHMSCTAKTAKIVIKGGKLVI